MKFAHKDFDEIQLLLPKDTGPLLWGFRFFKELNWAVGPFFLGDYGC